MYNNCILSSFSTCPKRHINIRILQNMVSGLLSSLNWALEPEREILMFMWSFRPLSWGVTDFWSPGNPGCSLTSKLWGSKLK